MFIKMPMLKKLLKEAYKNNNLLLGHNIHVSVNGEITAPEGYYISNRSNWMIWVEAGSMEKELKGELIRLVDFLPEAGHVGIYGQESNRFDDEIEEGVNEKLYLLPLLPSCELFEVSSVTIHQMLADARVLQRNSHEELDNEPALINEFFAEIINPGGISEENGEFELIGPYRARNNWMCWNSGKCYFAVAERKPNMMNDDSREFESELLDLLRTMRAYPYEEK